MPEIHDSESGNLCQEFCKGKKLTCVQQAELWSLFLGDPDRPTGKVIRQFAREGKALDVSVRYVNRLRARLGGAQ